jgi:diaminopimelate decarboxylase
MKMGGGAKPFGLDAGRVPELARRIIASGAEWRGFHIFAGSQALDAEAIADTQAQTLLLAAQLAEETGVSLPHCNLGGGFGIPYFPGETPLDLAPIGANLTTIVSRARDEMPTARIVIELGRYVVGEAGVYVCRIVDRKESRGQVFLVTDGGLHHHLAASGNFGQVLRKNYPVAIANRMGGSTCERASVVGPLCTPLDLLADQMDLAAAEPGDLVAVFQSGAYGASASPQAFLSHPHVLEVLV